MTKNTKYQRISPITTDVQGIMQIFCVGRNKAMEIGKAAGAVIHLSSRRTLYSVEKIKAYMDGLAEKGGAK